LKSEIAIHYRLYKDSQRWRVFVTVGIPKTPSVTSSSKGVIGVDVNVDHIAATELDRFGNPVAVRIFPLVTYGKDTHQAEALIGDVCAGLVAWAEETGKDLIYEKLDFARKKETLRDHNPKYARMLSSFAYSCFTQTLQGRAWRKGVDLHAVNPAYTSIIGRVKFASRYGLTTHQAAACVIGRRYLRLSEREPRHLDTILGDKDTQGTSPLPVRKRGEHVWVFWALLYKILKTAHAAHSSTPKWRSSHPPNDDACDTSSRDAGETPARESASSTARETS